MARGKGRRFYYNAGGQTNPGDASEWEPRVDKNPFYRTMEIFNGVFKKNIKLRPGQNNATDLHTIYVNFGELKAEQIHSYIKDGKDSSHAIYLLRCGHEWEGRTTNSSGHPKVIGQDYGMCGVCGAEQIYRGFEHEWQHIIFKSDLAARKVFVDLYAEQLVKTAPNVDEDELKQFLHLLVNAFDDIRVNSLWEKVYPGSAQAIWERWRFYTLKMGDAVNSSFLAYIFAVAFGLPTDQQGDFEAMRPVVEWAAQKVRYRGFANMLIDVKVVIDRCMGTLLARIPPPPPKGMQPPPPPSLTPPQQLPQTSGGAGTQDGTTQSNQGPQQQGAMDGKSQNQEDQANDKPQPGDHESQDQAVSGAQAAPSGQESSSDQAVEEEGSSPGSTEKGQGGGSQEADGGELRTGSGQGIKSLPSAKDVQATDEERSEALKKLIANPFELDPKEEHLDPTDEDLAAAQKSQSTRLMVARALNQDISNLDDLESTMPTGEPDEDMKRQIEQLQNSVTVKSEASQLTGGAKARITLIDVTSEGTPSGDVVELDEDERFAIQRMRSAFYRTMGRQKAKHSPQGNVVDVQALIQYRGDHQDPNVFENEDINQGFAYSLVCDMSGSMQGTFPSVCRATEILKQALHFPFVMGNLWGFRGGERVPGRGGDIEGEVWMYRYANDVTWYTGTTPHRIHQGFNGTVTMPVKCGGITPMNAAINVTSTHLWRKMPAGMAKRMFLLTDGAPMQIRRDGKQLPEYALRQFVAKEIREARKHGIQVYTIVIGQHAIDDEKCLQMFGPRKYWRRVGADRVGTVLASLVLANFSRYIRARG
jgi:hypothetical protein